METNEYVALLDKMEEWADFYRLNSATFSHAYDFANSQGLVGSDLWKYVAVSLGKILDDMKKAEYQRQMN